jgi:hypothetical protein
MRYMQNKILGFDKEHIVSLPYSTQLNDRYEAFRNELLAKFEHKKCWAFIKNSYGTIVRCDGSQDGICGYIGSCECGYKICIS